MRKLLGLGLSASACRKQEPIAQAYVDELMEKLRHRALKRRDFGGEAEKSVSDTHDGGGGGAAEEEGEAGIINVTSWYNFLTFDLTGDLTFGESFSCLCSGSLHPWVETIFKFVKGMTLAASARYYPWLETLLLHLLPPSFRKIHRDHYQIVLDKVHRRLNLETERNDFMTPILRDNERFDKMSLQEIESTFSVVVIAGSETTATTLAGMTNYLIQSPVVLEKLVSEVRSRFESREEITFAALEQLPYLTATIQEALRLCNPLPAGLPYVVPQGGATVCGHVLPEKVGFFSPSKIMFGIQY